MKKFALLLGILFLLVSCEKESSTELTYSKDNQTALKGAKLGAPSDNAVVFRYEDWSAWGLYDENSDLTAYIGLDVSIWCAGDFWGSLDYYTIQDINLEDPDEVVRTIRLINGEATISVYNGDVYDPCGMEPVWEGTAHIIYTDNDVEPNGPNHNSWGLTAIGDGFSLHWRSVWDGDWETGWNPVVTFVKIKLK